jgi:hypothetical protein
MAWVDCAGGKQNVIEDFCELINESFCYFLKNNFLNS